MKQPAQAGILFTVLIAFLTACDRSPESAPAPAPPPRQARNYFKTHFQDESQFIIESILTDLTEMTCFAKSNSLPAEISVAAMERSDSQFRKPHYDLKITIGTQPILDQSLKIEKAIWSPELYLGVTKTLLGDTAPPVNRHDPDDLSVAEALTDLLPATIEAQNQRVSSLLATNFADPTLHEMAAVLLGSFALREFSGYFYDVRSPLCRMTAHLALARGLSAGRTGINGQLAEALLSTLMNNQTEALAKLKPLESQPKLKPWVVALRARNTYDYRPLEGRSDLTRLEWIIYFQATSRCISADSAWTKLPPALHKTSSDFSRIAYGEGRSVGLGHELNESSLVLEFAETGAIYSQFSTADPTPEELLKFLNLPPERCFTGTSNSVRIIGPGQWGTFEQRHLCHALRGTFNFLQRSWGVPEEAKRFTDESDEKYGTLRLYPFVQRLNCLNEAEYRAAVDKGQPVTMATPHLVAPDIWNYIAFPPKFAQFYWPYSHPHANEWHKHNPPPGTAYNPSSRRYHPSLVNRPDSAQVLGELHELAPYDEHISQELLKLKYQGKETYAQVEEVYRPLLEYSSEENWRLAPYAKSDPTRYEQVMLRNAKLNPGGYFTLAEYFADRDQDEKAARYYEKGIELDTDAVRMSNNCNWLVRYYFRKGEKAKAEELADRAAEVYSSAGLRAKADLMELEENHDEAFKYFRRIEERYNQSGPLVGFCVRYKVQTGSHRFDDFIETRIKALFPRGLEKVGLARFKSAPHEGVLIDGENDALKQVGLKKGDVIVALDGLAVYDNTQYQYVRTLTNGPMQLIVWNGTQFAETTANPSNRLFGVQFQDYSHHPSN